jgi:hypothetical protein
MFFGFLLLAMVALTKKARGFALAAWHVTLTRFGHWRTGESDCILPVALEIQRSVGKSSMLR